MYFRSSDVPERICGPVLLARNPCHGFDDVQKATCVDLFDRLRRIVEAGPESDTGRGACC